MACVGNHLELARLLIERGADVNGSEAVRTRTCADVPQDQRRALHCASLHGRADAVRLLLDAGAAVDAVNAVRVRASRAPRLG